ncbi:MAG: hypothetical protein Satyrvirus4_31 [Satyrvirus sp.]|uniref:Uncharacterized protein n=1 Tax=Satyrvirus sp. TaxID=2487771 RepID=A0A3G5AEX3_9VIRU|nr:MAG: hypothetical protein Satyrvirus4_31 [Satyrvirus sp.]
MANYYIWHKKNSCSLAQMDKRRPEQLLEEAKRYLLETRIICQRVHSEIIRKYLPDDFDFDKNKNITDWQLYEKIYDSQKEIALAKQITELVVANRSEEEEEATRIRDALIRWVHSATGPEYVVIDSWNMKFPSFKIGFKNRENLVGVSKDFIRMVNENEEADESTEEAEIRLRTEKSVQIHYTFVGEDDGEIEFDVLYLLEN